jgi:hypothetical protein
MAENLDYYVNVLSGSKSGLSAISALQSLDNAAVKASGSIQALEGKVQSAQRKLEAAQRSGDPTKQAKALEAVKSAQEKLSAAQKAQADSAGLVAAKRNLIKKGLDEQVSKLSSFANAAKEAGGPLGSLVGKLESLGKGGKVGLAIAVAVALAAIAASAIIATVALAKYALVASDAARSSQLLSAAATGSGSAGWELETVVDQLSNKIPQARQKTAEWARELALANIAGRDMQRTLTTMGTVASAVGDSAAGKIKGIAEASRMAQRLMLGARDRFGEFASLQGTGIKAADIYAAVAKSMRTSIPEAKRMVDAGIIPFKRGLEALEQAAETRFGPIVARQMMSLDVQAAKLKENIAKLFSGANIESFLAGLKTVTDLFDTNTVTGYVLREVFTAVFTKIAELASKVFPYVKAAIEGVVVGVLIFAIAAKQLYRQFQETFGGAGKGIDGMALAFKIGVGIVATMVGSIVALTAAIAFLGLVAVTALAPIWIPIALFVALVYLGVKAAEALGSALSSVWESIKSVDLSKAAANIMDSLIKGIKSRIADVKSAISEVGGAILGAFDSKMEIQSPSKAMTRRAHFVVDPLEDVPEQRAGDVRQAIGGLGDLDKPQGGRGGGGNGVHIEKIEIIIQGGSDDAETIARKIDERLTMRFMSETRGMTPVPG